MNITVESRNGGCGILSLPSMNSCSSFAGDCNGEIKAEHGGKDILCSWSDNDAAPATHLDNPHRPRWCLFLPSLAPHNAPTNNTNTSGVSDGAVLSGMGTD
ncbi:hypothetical protein ILYODFUR_020339 [Ilyodon furcidens]|uniref:Uncharacterized protein n=1 Tax=Ilyodon furcidens TaxID=33524 RepID=A0ABV0T9K5_9TELE